LEDVAEEEDSCDDMESYAASKMVLHLESVNKLSALGSTLLKDGIFFRGYSCTEELRKINQKGS
jgi:hypothetical protein